MVTDTLPEQGCVITNPREWLDRPAQRCMPSGLALSYAAQSLTRAALSRPRRSGHGRRSLGLALTQSRRLSFESTRLEL